MRRAPRIRRLSARRRKPVAPDQGPDFGDAQGVAPAAKRILVLNPSYPPQACGVGAYTRGLAHALVDTGQDVTVVTCATSTPMADGPPRVLALLHGWGIGALVRASPRFARPRADVVVSSYPAIVDGSYTGLYLVPAMAKLLLGRPRTVFIVHEFVRSGDIEQRLLRLAFWAADRIVAVTEAERDAILGRYPSLSARTVVRHNPPTIPVVALDPQADARLRAELGPPERPVIGFVGSLWTEGKGFEDLLGALVGTDVLLVATGSLDPGNAYHAQVAALIERLKLGGQVRWMGFVSDEEAGRLLRAVDAVVLPYRGGAESGYTSMLAALVNGAAVITTSGPRTPPWLRDGETALLVAPGDPPGLQAAIDRVVGDERLGANLRAGARELRFGWDGIVEAVLAAGDIAAEEPAGTVATRSDAAPPGAVGSG